MFALPTSFLSFSDARQCHLLCDLAALARSFRTRSARIIWLVQVTSEMFSPPPKNPSSPDQTSRLYFDKFVSFARRCLDRWSDLEVTHSLSVYFFSRTYISGRGTGAATVNTDAEGRTYEDHYFPVLENATSSDWPSLLPSLKRSFAEYPRRVDWRCGRGSTRLPSSAQQGNLLEAINITLNVLQYHYMDRDLSRTGNSIVVVSPGDGVFEVDKDLAGITRQR